MKRCRIKTTRQSPSARCHAEIVCSGKSGDRIKKNRYFLLMLYQTARTLNYHLRNTSVMLRKLIKCRINNFNIIPLDFFLDIGNLLRTFIDQQNDQVHGRVVFKE